MNLVISLEVYKMLKTSRAGIRYFPPTIKRVWTQILAVYAYGLILSTVTFMIPDNSDFPFQVGVYSGYFCMPVQYNLASTLIFFLIFLPLAAGIPMATAGYVFYDVYFGNHLMPKNGKGKLLAIYFMRIIIVFFVWWFPGILISLVWTGINPWYQWGSGSVFSHLQGCASAVMTLRKPDVKEATWSFLFRCCRPLRLDVVNQEMMALRASSEEQRQSRRGPNIFVTGFTDHFWRRPGRSSGPSPVMSAASEVATPAMHGLSATIGEDSEWYDVTAEEMQNGMDLNAEIAHHPPRESVELMESGKEPDPEQSLQEEDDPAQDDET